VSSIQQTADGLQSQITDNKNNISQLEQNVEGFKTTVSSQLDSMETNIQQTTEAIELSANKIEELENKKVVTSSTPYFYLSDSNTQLVGFLGNISSRLVRREILLAENSYHLF